MKPGLVPAIGWLAIAHGLSHAVLPMRGSIAPTIAFGDWTPVLLYATSMLGFVAAGLGLIGLRPLDVAISPLLVVSSGLSLVAIERLGQPDLWPGATFDIAFFGLGLWRSYAGWPIVARRHARAWHVLGLVFGFAFLAYVATATVLWPWHRTWGSTRAEIAMPLPGDRQMRDPAFETQHAVTIDVAPEDVWPRLVQFLNRRGWPTAELEAGRALIANCSAFVLLPAGAGRTRLIVRTRVSQPKVPAWAAGMDFVAFELPHFISERRMMLTVKALAEQRTDGIAVSR